MFQRTSFVVSSLAMVLSAVIPAGCAKPPSYLEGCNAGGVTPRTALALVGAMRSLAAEYCDGQDPFMEKDVDFDIDGDGVSEALKLQKNDIGCSFSWARTLDVGWVIGTRSLSFEGDIVSTAWKGEVPGSGEIRANWTDYDNVWVDCPFAADDSGSCLFSNDSRPGWSGGCTSDLDFDWAGVFQSAAAYETCYDLVPDSCPAICVNNNCNTDADCVDEREGECRDQCISTEISNSCS